jgi:hypothetical protein
LQRVHELLLPMRLKTIARHPDSGGWMAVFPYRLHGYHTAADLADRVYRVLRDVAVPTPFGSGRLFKPDRWFVSFAFAGPEPTPGEPPDNALRKVA